MGKWKDKTRGGFEYRIWTEDAKCSSKCPIRGEVRDGAGEWLPRCWRVDGVEQFSATNGLRFDLVPAERWLRGDQLEVGMTTSWWRGGAGEGPCSRTVAYISTNGIRWYEHGCTMCSFTPHNEYLVSEQP